MVEESSAEGIGPLLRFFARSKDCDYRYDKGTPEEVPCNHVARSLIMSDE